MHSVPNTISTLHNSKSLRFTCYIYSKPVRSSYIYINNSVTISTMSIYSNQPFSMEFLIEDQFSSQTLPMFYPQILIIQILRACLFPIFIQKLSYLHLTLMTTFHFFKMFTISYCLYTFSSLH